MTERDEELDQIRKTYARYRRNHRERLWDASNRGYARMARDRDAHLVELLRSSVSAAGGRILDLGCGDGRLASLTQAAGLEMDAWVGVDLDPVAVASASATQPWATFIEASADLLPFEAASFDVVVASTLFSSLPSENLARAVANESERVLVPRGWLVWYDLRYDNPRNPDVHGVGADALGRLFPGWTSELRSTTLLPPIARRLGPATPVLYPLLESIPPLRSHLIGRLRRPPNE